jgi:hypothetical protein
MATGLLDSREHFGINGQDKDRVQVRRSATCSPITTDGYMKSGTSSIAYHSFNNHSNAGLITFNYTAAFYGDSNENHTLYGLDDPALDNTTYIYTNFREVALPSYSYNAPSYDIM